MSAFDNTPPGTQTTSADGGGLAAFDNTAPATQTSSADGGGLAAHDNAAPGTQTTSADGGGLDPHDNTAPNTQTTGADGEGLDPHDNTAPGANDTSDQEFDDLPNGFGSVDSLIGWSIVYRGEDGTGTEQTLSITDNDAISSGSIDITASGDFSPWPTVNNFPVELRKSDESEAYTALVSDRETEGSPYTYTLTTFKRVPVTLTPS